MRCWFPMNTTNPQRFQEGARETCKNPRRSLDLKKCAVDARHTKTVIRSARLLYALEAGRCISTRSRSWHTDTHTEETHTEATHPEERHKAGIHSVDTLRGDTRTHTNAERLATRQLKWLTTVVWCRRLECAVLSSTAGAFIIEIIGQGRRRQSRQHHSGASMQNQQRQCDDCC